MSTERPHARGTIAIERTYRASVEDAWDLWTTKEGFESWWGPEGFRAEVTEIDARVGGVLRYEMIAHAPDVIAEMTRLGQPSSHPVRSTYTEIQLHRRLVITNVIDFIPGVAPYESRIAADFFASKDGVRMVVTLDALHDPEWTMQQRAGMTSQITKLDHRFATRSE